MSRRTNLRGTEATCRGCGAPVLRYRDPETGLVTDLEDRPLPITADPAALTPSPREWLGPRIGWVPLYGPRTWRELRAVHTCPRTHETESEHEHEPVQH